MAADLKAAAWTITTAPPAEPLTTAEAKQHLRVDVPDEDDLIDAYVLAARQHVEEVTGRALITTELTALYRGFPSDDLALELPRAPVQQVSAVRYTVKDGTTSTLPPSAYEVDADGEPGRVLLAPDESWPTDELRQPNPVEVDFTAGYGDAGSDVPGPIRSYMRLLLGALYENREQTVTGTIVSELGMAQSLLVPYRVFWPV